MSSLVVRPCQRGRSTREDGLGLFFCHFIFVIIRGATNDRYPFASLRQATDCPDTRSAPITYRTCESADHDRKLLHCRRYTSSDQTSDDDVRLHGNKVWSSSERAKSGRLGGELRKGGIMIARASCSVYSISVRMISIKSITSYHIAILYTISMCQVKVAGDLSASTSVACDLLTICQLLPRSERS